eukprot:scaffold16447_cov116-Isochrysis_galbana.AAC.5
MAAAARRPPPLTALDSPRRPHGPSLRPRSSWRVARAVWRHTLAPWSPTGPPLPRPRSTHRPHGPPSPARRRGRPRRAAPPPPPRRCTRASCPAPHQPAPTLPPPTVWEERTSRQRQRAHAHQRRRCVYPPPEHRTPGYRRRRTRAPNTAGTLAPPPPAPSMPGLRRGASTRDRQRTSPVRDPPAPSSPRLRPRPPLPPRGKQPSARAPPEHESSRCCRAAEEEEQPKSRSCAEASVVRPRWLESRRGRMMWPACPVQGAVMVARAVPEDPLPPSPQSALPPAASARPGAAGLIALAAALCRSLIWRSCFAWQASLCEQLPAHLFRTLRCPPPV